MTWDEVEWDDDDFEDDPPSPPSAWRRRTFLVVGLVVAAAMLAGPIWNIVEGATPQVSDSGLELCGFDYCVVQDAVRAAGHDLTMSRLSTTLLDESDAQALADELIAFLGGEPVTVEVVDRIDRRISGQYHPASRRILLERPARAWIVLHEVAHTEALGHGDDFLATTIDLARWLESSADG